MLIVSSDNTGYSAKTLDFAPHRSTFFNESINFNKLNALVNIFAPLGIHFQCHLFYIRDDRYSCRYKTSNGSAKV